MLTERKGNSNLSTRILEIDGLRAFAIAIVVLYHVYGKVFIGGYIGVDIFFVISGYLITSLLLIEFQKSGMIEFRSFYIRRIRRLLPAHLFLIFVIIFATVLAQIQGGFHGEKIYYAALASAFSVMNWIRAFNIASSNLFAHTWSLAIEEQFYLVWPVALLCLLSWMTKRTSNIVIVSFMIMAVAWRTIAFNLYGIERSYFGLDTRADSLLIGCILGLNGIPSGLKSLKRAWILPLSFIVFVSFSSPVEAAWMHYGGYTLVAVSTAWIIVSAVKNLGYFGLVLRSAPAVWLGTRSYSLYLWHFPILIFVKQTGVLGIAHGPVTILVSLLAAELSYRFVEKPFLKSRSTYPWKPSKEEPKVRAVPPPPSC